MTRRPSRSAASPHEGGKAASPGDGGRAALPGRRLAAILAARVDGPEALVKSVHDSIVGASGVVFSGGGDAILAEFASASEALTLALRLQANASRVDEGKRVRFGLAAGEILVSRTTVGGEVIALASGLGAIAPAGGIALPVALHDQLRHSVPIFAEPMGSPEMPDGPVAVAGISAEACRAWGQGTVAGAGVGTGAGSLARKRVRPRPGDDARISLAVVPFVSGRDHPLLNAFTGLATDEVIRRLNGLATWIGLVRLPAVTMRAPVDLQRLRSVSGARYILHGHAEAARDMLRLTVELNDAESGRVLWSERFDRKAEQEEALRADAAPRIAGAVPPLLLQRELDRLALVPPDAVTAQALALRAYALIMRPTRAGFDMAGRMLAQAERLTSPHPVVAYAMVWWHVMAIEQGWSPDPVGQALAAEQASAMLDRNDPAAKALLAWLPSVVHQDHAAASAMLEQVIDAAPFCGLGWSLKALTLCRLNEGEAAIPLAEQAAATAVLGAERAWQGQVVALACYMAGRYGDAVRWARVAATEHPGLAETALILTASLSIMGRLDEARQAAQNLLSIDPAFRIAGWRERSLLPEAVRDVLGQRLRLAGLD